jgi:hypothetical protein
MPSVFGLGMGRDYLASWAAKLPNLTPNTSAMFILKTLRHRIPPYEVFFFF